MTPDRIEREILIAAPIERVWAVVTSAEHVGTWFGDAGATIDLRPGGAMTITWREHGTALARVERVEPPRLFSYRWGHAAGVEPVPGRSTLVEFTLTPEGIGTRLRVVESGFRSLDLPEDERSARVKGNAEGWRIQLGNVRDYLARIAA